MTADPDLEDLLPDDIHPAKGRAAPLKRGQFKNATVKADAKAITPESPTAAARLAQIVNLHIAGFSLADIGAAVGSTPEEIDRMLAQDTARYVRSQPALRTYVRNWVSSKYTGLLESVWDGAVDVNARDQLERQDRALRILDRMAKLHGAEAPTQTEITVDAAPEAVEKMVAALAAQSGAGYDVSVFDTVVETVDAEVVHEAVEQSALALGVSGDRVEEPQDGDSSL